MKVLPGYVAVEILKEEHDRKLFTEVKMANGEVRRFQISIPAAKNYDNHFEQGISVGKLVAIGEGVQDMQPGDLAVIDYTLDTDHSEIIYKDRDKKIVRAPAVNTYFQEDILAPATKIAKADTYSQRKGDHDMVSLIFGIIHGESIVPVFPYVFLRYVNLDGVYIETESNGLLTPANEGDVVVREVLFVHPKSKLKPGARVLLLDSDVYEREVNDEVISICMEEDIMAEI